MLLAIEPNRKQAENRRWDFRVGEWICFLISRCKVVENGYLVYRIDVLYVRYGFNGVAKERPSKQGK